MMLTLCKGDEYTIFLVHIGGKQHEQGKERTDIFTAKGNDILYVLDGRRHMFKEEETALHVFYTTGYEYKYTNYIARK